MARARQKKSPNADLVKAVQDRTEDILDLYEEVEDDRPVLVLDFEKQTIGAYHYEGSCSMVGSCLSRAHPLYHAT